MYYLFGVADRKLKVPEAWKLYWLIFGEAKLDYNIRIWVAQPILRSCAVHFWAPFSEPKSLSIRRYISNLHVLSVCRRYFNT